MCCRLYGSFPSVHSLSDKFHVGVDDDDGVVDNHSQCHNECCEGYGVQFYMEREEQSQRDKDRDGDGRCCHQCHSHGHEEQHDDDDGDDRNKEFFEEVDDGVFDHFCLVGDAEEFHALGQCLLKGIELLVDLGSHIGDAASGFYFYAEHDAFHTVVGDIRRPLGIFMAHGSHVFQPDGDASRIAVDDGFLDIGREVQRARHIDWRVVAAVFQCAGSSGEVFPHEGHGYHLVADAILRQPVIVYIDGNLFFLLTDYRHAAHALYGAQSVFQVVHVVGQFAIGLVLRLHGDEHR